MDKYTLQYVSLLSRDDCAEVLRRRYRYSFQTLVWCWMDGSESLSSIWLN